MNLANGKAFLFIGLGGSIKGLSEKRLVLLINSVFSLSSSPPFLVRGVIFLDPSGLQIVIKVRDSPTDSSACRGEFDTFGDVAKGYEFEEGTSS